MKRATAAAMDPFEVQLKFVNKVVKPEVPSDAIVFFKALIYNTNKK